MAYIVFASMVAALLGMAQVAFATSSAAQVTQRDLLVLARALSFLDGAPSGDFEIGIVFPEGSAPGRIEAERIAAAFGNGLRSGAAILRPRLVLLQDSAKAEVRVLLFTEAALPRVHEVAAAVAGRGVLTVATERSAVEASGAVMAVRAEPRVEILVSSAAAQAADVRFATAFRMMIRER